MDFFNYSWFVARWGKKLGKRKDTRQSGLGAGATSSLPCSQTLVSWSGAWTSSHLLFHKDSKRALYPNLYLEWIHKQWFLFNFYGKIRVPKWSVRMLCADVRGCLQVDRLHAHGRSTFQEVLAV